MGAALKIHESWPNFRPLLASRLAGFADDEPQRPLSINDDQQARQIEQHLEHGRRWAEDLIRRARASIADGGPSDIDETIELLEREDGAFIREFAAAIKKARKPIERIPKRHADRARQIAREIDWFENIIVQHEELLRDLRWQLMVVRAESRRDKSGPVFDDPNALRRYLRTR